MIAAHLRLRPVPFKDDGLLSQAWDYRRSLFELEDNRTRDLSDRNTFAPAGSGGVAGAPAFDDSPGAGARTVSPLHGGVLYAVPEA